MLVQEKLNQLFTNPKQKTLIQFYQKNSIIISPNVIWDLLLLFEYLDESKQVKYCFITVICIYYVVIYYFRAEETY